MAIYTIGFTKKTAEQFFGTLKLAKAKYLLDIRLNNKSQLAGFTKNNDIGYFLEKLTGITYIEMPILAPTKSILDDYRKTKNWPHYERSYINLLSERKVENALDKQMLEQGVILLCSEPKPTKCHRRLAAEYLQLTMDKNIDIQHL